MTTRPSRSPTGWLPYVGCASLVIGCVYQAGQLTSRIDRNTERIIALETADKARSLTIETINMRGARIEAKLDLIVPDKVTRKEDR